MGKKTRVLPFQVYLWRREDLEDLASSASPNKGGTVFSLVGEFLVPKSYFKFNVLLKGNLDGESYVAAGAGRLRLACGTSNRFCDLDLVV